MKIKKKYKKWLLALTTLTIVVFIGELVVRFKYRAFPFEKEIIWTNVSDKDRILRWKPPHKEDTNTLGLRNREIKAKQKQYRILFLGDSLLWGGITSTKKQYTRIIEENLNKNLQIEIETINAGIYGYTTYQELQFLKIHGLNMEPNFVVLVFCFNDLYYKYLHRPTNEKTLDIDPIARLDRFNGNKIPILGNSYLAHAIIQLKDSFSAFPFDKKPDFFLAWRDYGWDKEEKVLLEMKKIIEDNNAKFAIISLPISDQVNDNYLNLNREYVLYPQHKLKEICKKNNIFFLDLHHTIYNGGGTKLFKDYLHLNSIGNDLVAEKVTDFLTELGVWTK